MSIVYYTVNDITLPRFSFEQSSLFLKRVAHKFNTIPEHILIVDDYECRMNIVRLEDFIQDDAMFSLSFNEIYEKVKSFNLSEREFANLFIYLNQDSLNHIYLHNHSLYEELDRIVEHNFNPNNTYSLLYQKKLTDLIHNMKQTKYIYDSILSQVSVEASPLEYIDKTIEYRFETTLDQEEWFNRLCVSEEIPLIYYKNRFKICKEIQTSIPNLTSDEHIYIMYLNCLISFKFIIYGNQFQVSFQLENTMDLKEKVLNSLQSVENVILTESEVYLTSKFTLTNYHLDYPLLQHLVLNDTIFSYFFSMNEFNLVAKSRTKASYLHFNFNDHRLIVQYKYDHDYVEMIIRNTKSYQMTEDYYNLFCRIFSTYNQEKKNSIIKSYREYIVDIERFLTSQRKKQNETKKRKMLKYEYPQLFRSGYTRLCQNSPVILSEEEYKNQIDKERIIRFPKNDQDALVTGLIPQYFCSNNLDYPYVGLRTNRLSNAIQVPIIPCLMKKNQKKKKKGLYYLYYQKDYSIEQMKQYIHQQNERNDAFYIYTKDKLLPPNRKGQLPEKCQRIFSSIDVNDYYRYGVYRSVNSCIESIMISLNYSDCRMLSLAERQNLAKTIRLDLINYIDTSDHWQQIQDKLTIVNLLMGDQYLDPKRLLKLLEHYFECNILLFIRNISHPSGTIYSLNQSECTQSYTKYICLYEHDGSERDQLQYPQCELIISDEFHFHSESVLVQRLIDIQSKMYPDYMRVHYPFQSIPYCQKVDSIGKPRYLVFKSNSSIMYLLCYDMPPIPRIRTISNLSLCSNTLEHVFEFVTVEKIQNIQIVHFQNQSIGLFFTKESFSFFIPICSVTHNYSVMHRILDPLWMEHLSNATDHIQLYQYQHKIARILKEYTFYLFSIDYDKYQDINITHDYIERNFIVDTLFTYPTHISRIFNLHESFIRNKKLVVCSEELLKRLIYYLQLEIKQNCHQLIKYSHRLYMQHYYSEHFDYTLPSNTILFTNQNSYHSYMSISR
jgi:hypothetical protein